MNRSSSEKPRLPLVCKCIYLLTALCAVLYLLFSHLPAFADWFNRTVSAFLRALLGTVTAIIPFSLAELLLLFLPFLLVALCVRGYRRHTDSFRAVLVYVGKIACLLCTVLILFVLCFAAGYQSPPLDEKLDLERREVSAEELYLTAELLREELETLEGEILYTESGASVMPYSLDEMNARLMEAFSAAAEKYDFLTTFPSRVKPVMLSEAMSYTHITGVYTFFTGEANVNVNFPDYTVPYTAAHELSHQRGIAREDEANFVAFLVCMESDDPYLRYSGLLNLYEYVASALRRADSELYLKSYRALPREILAEERAYSAFFDRYRDSVAATVTEATNDAYLKGQGAAAGTKSYGMVVDLAVAICRPHLSAPAD